MNGIKKFVNFIMILIGVALIIVCADLVVNKTVNTSYKSLEELDQKAIEDVCEVIALFDSRKGNKEVWNNNYNPKQMGCVLVSNETGRAYAVNYNASGHIFTQKMELPDDYSNIMVYRFSHISPLALKLRFAEENIGHIKYNDANLLYIQYDANAVELNGANSLKDQYVKTSFADALESPDMPKADEPASFKIDEENIALTGLQYRIIDDMRMVSSRKELNELVAEYVMVRDYQDSLYPEFKNYKERVELGDGRVQFVFYKISDLTGGDMSYFNKSKSDEINFYSAYHYLCIGKYNDNITDFLNYKGNVYTGAALCEILDENKISSDWTYKLDNSSNADFRSQYTLIKKYCQKNCGELSKDKTVDNIKDAYNYDEIMAMAKALVSGQQTQE